MVDIVKHSTLYICHPLLLITEHTTINDFKSKMLYNNYSSALVITWNRDGLKQDTGRGWVAQWGLVITRQLLVALVLLSTLHPTSFPPTSP